MIIEDLIRWRLRRKYRKTGKWSKADQAVNLLMPRSPLSAGMFVTRRAMNRGRTRPTTNAKREPTYSQPAVSGTEQERQVQGLGLDENIPEVEDMGVGL